MGDTQDYYDEICDKCEFQDSCDGSCTPDDCAHGEAWNNAHSERNIESTIYKRRNREGGLCTAPNEHNRQIGCERHASCFDCPFELKG